MKTRFAAALLALALPLCAQDSDPAAAEALFYKAYWLQNGERNFAEAMTLYTKFLAAAPEHALVSRAAQFQFELLTRAGKTADAEAFAKKYEKVLGKAAIPAPATSAPAGEGRGEGRGRPQGAEDMQARLADLKKQLEAAKQEGDEQAIQRLERQIRRMEQMGEGGGAAGPRGQAGPGGPGGRRGGMFPTKKLTEMSEEELGQFKDGMERMSGMIEMMRERNPDMADQLESSYNEVKKHLEAGKLEDAQQVLDKVREMMPQRGGRGGRGGGGGGGGGGN